LREGITSDIKSLATIPVLFSTKIVKKKPVIVILHYNYNTDNFNIYYNDKVKR
jgi:hypothetical protein